MILKKKMGKEIQRDKEFWGEKQFLNAVSSILKKNIRLHDSQPLRQLWEHHLQRENRETEWLDRGHHVRGGGRRHITRQEALPTSARLSPNLAAAGGSRSRDTAWILHKRSLRSVFCARAWNMLKIVGLC